MKKNKVNAAILIIGNEILSGRTKDKNIAFLSNWLNTNCGITVSEVRIIPDVEKIIVKNIKLLSPTQFQLKNIVLIMVIQKNQMNLRRLLCL